MNSITQFWSDYSYKSAVSNDGNYVIKHGDDNETFLLFNNGILIQEFHGENCLFLENNYILKFPCHCSGYHDESFELILIKLEDITKIEIPYPEEMFNILCSRVAVYSLSNNQVYFYSNVISETKDYTKYLYCLNVSKLIQSSILEILEANLDFEPNTSFLQIFNDILICADKENSIVQINLPLQIFNNVYQFSKMKSFTITPTTDHKGNYYLKREVQAYFHSEYSSGAGQWQVKGSIENIICTLKNDITPYTEAILQNVSGQLEVILRTDLPQILKLSGKNNLVVCVVPRAKVNYNSNQLYFKKIVSKVANQLQGFIDGTDYIKRVKDTKTTHRARSGHGGNGDMPYPNITLDTCNFSLNVKGKDILLIDDLYTNSVNIDEDAIQALFDKGANSVIFYSIGAKLGV